MIDVHANREVHNDKCSLCSRRAEYHVSGGVSWDVCPTHASIAVHCGFTAWDRDGTLMGMERASEVRAARAS